MSMYRVFISYSRDDERWKDSLVDRLSKLQSQICFDFWDDTRIASSANWFTEFETAINLANVAILMISARFLSSNFILQKEIHLLLQRRRQETLRVIPIIIEQCDWQAVDWLAKILARPMDGRPLSAGDEYQIESDLALIVEDIRKALDKKDSGDWEKKAIILPPDKVYLANLPSTSSILFGREKEIKWLNAAWNNQQTNIVILIAWGGVGKTALVNAWLNEMAKEDYHRTERVYGYSFYSESIMEMNQSSTEIFFSSALKWFGEVRSNESSFWNKGKRLAELIQKQRTLLILDGLDSLQHFSGGPEGRIKDPDLQYMLREIARYNPGLCIITTRMSVNDLKDFSSPSVQQINLEHLSSIAGVELLKHFGVNGASTEIRKAVGEFDGHALALTLLGRYLVRVYKGDIRQRDKIAKLTEGINHGGHARRVMASYEKWFKGMPELDFLHVMGLFDHPVALDVIKALVGNQPIMPKNVKELFSAVIQVFRSKPAIKGLTTELRELSNEEWYNTIKNLREAGLLAPKNPGRTGLVDCHTLVREYFGDRLKKSNPATWKKAHNRLYEYCKSHSKEYPGTIEEMMPLYSAVAHGCQAGRYRKVLVEVYCKRILREREYFSIKKLGTISADLAALTNFFDRPWSIPVAALRKDMKRFILANTGFCLRAQSRLTEAVQPMEAGLTISMSQKDWKNAAIVAGNLSELYLVIGNIAKALEYAEQSIELADRSGDTWQRIVARVQLADTLHQSDRLKESEAIFMEAEEIQKQRGTEYSVLWSTAGMRYCDLLLELGKAKEALHQTEQALSYKCNGNYGLLDIAMDHLSLGRAYLLMTFQDGKEEYAIAMTHLDQALNGLRQAGTQHHIPRGLIARAELYRVCGNFEHAQLDLDEAITIATIGNMGLHQADCHIEYARLGLAKGEKDKVREHLTTAKEMIERMGYYRRDKDLIELERTVEEQMRNDKNRDKREKYEKMETCSICTLGDT